MTFRALPCELILRLQTIYCWFNMQRFFKDFSFAKEEGCTTVPSGSGTL